MAVDSFRFRSNLVLVFLCIWAVAAAAHVFYYTSVRSDRLNEESSSIAWRNGIIPPLRGRICDRNRIPLAWTRIHHDLLLNSASLSERRFRRLEQALKERKLPCFGFLNKDAVILKESLTPEQIRDLAPLLRSYPELSVRIRFERCRIDCSVLKPVLGEIGFDEDGIPHGIDGIEREQDELLSGVPGQFTVMLDKMGNWLEGTLEILKEPVPGQDLILDISLEEWKRESDDDE